MKNLEKLSDFVAGSKKNSQANFVNLLANRITTTKDLEGESKAIYASLFFHSPVGIQFLLSDHTLNPVVGKCHAVKG